MSVCNPAQHDTAQIRERMSATQDKHGSLSTKVSFIGFSIGFCLLFCLFWFHLVGCFVCLRKYNGLRELWFLKISIDHICLYSLFLKIKVVARYLKNICVCMKPWQYFMLYIMSYTILIFQKSTSSNSVLNYA